MKLEIIKVLITPKPNRKPFYQTTDYENDYSFLCDECGKLILIDSKKQIDSNWNGKTNSVTKRDFDFLKTYYRIGLNNKSADGGFPVFDKLTCSKCSSKFISYCGMKEFSNSAFAITLNGILKTESTNIPKSIRTNLTELIDLLGDYDKQIEYAKTVGDNTAIQEMVCMWFDDKYLPNSEYFIKEFTENELIKLKKFNEYYDSIVSIIPDQNIRTLHIDQHWEKLIRLAKKLKSELKT